MTVEAIASVTSLQPESRSALLPQLAGNAAGMEDFVKHLDAQKIEDSSKIHDVRDIQVLEKASLDVMQQTKEMAKFHISSMTFANIIHMVGVVVSGVKKLVEQQ